MSITFAPVVLDPRVRLTCICRATQSEEIFENPAEAYSFKSSVDYVPVHCPEEFCDNSQRYLSSAVVTPELNMSETNAHKVLEALSLEPAGELSAESFTGLVLFALAVLPKDEGLPSYDDSSYDAAGERVGAQFIVCGRREGYIQEKLEELRTIGNWAIENKTTVYWG